MKIAISGKGGVGKTTFASTLANVFKNHGKKVLAIDADPDANLATALGFSESPVTPISEMKELIAERTGVTEDSYSKMFNINPQVNDLPDTLAKEIDGLKFMTLGGVNKKGGAGCFCPESAFLRNLIMHLVLNRDEVVLMDMEAGLEHLGRATSTGVDSLIAVVEPGKRAIETAHSIRKMAKDLKIKKLYIVGNKIRNEKDRDFLKQELTDFNILGFLPYSENTIEADQQGISVYKHSPELVKEVEKMYEILMADAQK